MQWRHGMKSSKIKMTAVFLAAALMFAGCGEALYELTPEEQAAVVSYASHVVAKYNSYQKDGEVFVQQEVLDGVEETEEGADTQPDTQAPETETQEPDTQQETKPDAERPQEAQEDASDTVALETALNLGEISAEYTGCSLCTTYEKSDVYAVDAEPGQQLLVLNLSLKNQSDQDIALDILKMAPVISAQLNESKTVPAQTTILPNDLSTYQGSISAGKSAETVLLFQVPQDIQEVSAVQLKITIGQGQYKVNL